MTYLEVQKLPVSLEPQRLDRDPGCFQHQAARREPQDKSVCGHDHVRDRDAHRRDRAVRTDTPEERDPQYSLYCTATRSHQFVRAAVSSSMLVRQPLALALHVNKARNAQLLVNRVLHPSIVFSFVYPPSLLTKRCRIQKLWIPHSKFLWVRHQTYEVGDPKSDSLRDLSSTSRHSAPPRYFK